MAEGTKEGGDEGFSFVDKVRLMMYGEQEKEAFLIDKKEKEEKKKAKKLAKAAGGGESKEQSFFGQIKSFFTSESSKEDTKTSPEEITSPTPPDEAPVSSTDVTS